MALKYKGIGFIPGIPARDLTDDEVYQFGEIPLINTGLYEKEKVMPAAEKPVVEKPRKKESK